MIPRCPTAPRATSPAPRPRHRPRWRPRGAGRPAFRPVRPRWTPRTPAGRRPSGRRAGPRRRHGPPRAWPRTRWPGSRRPPPRHPPRAPGWPRGRRTTATLPRPRRRQRRGVSRGHPWAGARRDGSAPVTFLGNAHPAARIEVMAANGQHCAYRGPRDLVPRSPGRGTEGPHCPHRAAPGRDPNLLHTGRATGGTSRCAAPTPPPWSRDTARNKVRSRTRSGASRTLVRRATRGRPAAVPPTARPTPPTGRRPPLPGRP